MRLSSMEGRGKRSGDAGRLMRHTQSPSEKSSAQSVVQGRPSETLNYIECGRRHRQAFFFSTVA